MPVESGCETSSTAAACYPRYYCGYDRSCCDGSTDLGHSSPPRLYAADFYTEELLEPTRRAFDRFRRFFRAHRLDAVVVLIPDKDQVYKTFASEEERHRPNRVLSEILRELAIPHVDLLPQFLTVSGEPLYNMTPAGHLSVRGHLITAEILRAYVRELEGRSPR